MGSTYSLFSLNNLYYFFYPKKETKVAMIGLDAAGKTTILYKLKLGEDVRTVPTIGFNIETIEKENLRMVVWDVGGREKSRPFIEKNTLPGSHALIYVLDSSDLERFEEAKESFNRNVKSQDFPETGKILIFANKQDYEKHLSPEQIVKEWKLEELKQSWFIQPCVAINGEGLIEGITWLSNEL